MTTLWRVEQLDDSRFPYRITLLQGDRITLALRAKDRWPGPGGNVFCLREHEPPEPETAPEVIEEVPVQSVERLGRRLVLTLDRAKRRRCDFLFLTKAYKNRPGEYEQIFFRTQSAMRASKSRGRTQLFGDTELEILIDSAERYPWRFPGATTHREALRSGDYALYEHDQIQALVERKTFSNLLADLGQLQILHQQLAELAAHPHPALVIEAPYGHCLDPKRVAPWPATHVARALAEISAMHPSLPVIYAGNRKQANEWCHGFLRAVSARLADASPDTVADVRGRHYATPPSTGSDLTIRREVLEELPPRFTMRMLRNRLPDVAVSRLRAVLRRLRDEGRVNREGRGRASEWVRTR